MDLKGLFPSYIAIRSGKVWLTVSACAISVSHTYIAALHVLKVERPALCSYKWSLGYMSRPLYCQAYG